MNTSTVGENERPKALGVLAENIPEELKELRQWVTWKYVFKESKLTKPPYQVNGRELASSTDPETWGSFEDALKTYQSKRVDGVGFVVSENEEIIGIDLDHCFDLNARKGEPWAIDIAQTMQSYSELSPSGEGIRIFGKGNLPSGNKGRKRGNIEIYSAGRYLTVTGHRLKNAPLTIEPRQEEITWLWETYLKDKPKAERANGNGPWNPSDEELLGKAFEAKNSDKLKRLFDGDVSGYPSQSEADLSLCSLLAFWATDRAQLDRLFRRSALMRDKWDEKHGSTTYGERTVETAFANRTDHYSPNRAHGSVRDHQGSGASSSGDWPKPQKLPDALPLVPAMVPAMIPVPFRPWLCDIAERMQCPLDFPVIGAIITTGSLIGRQLAIRPKKQDDWTVIPNLWGGVVGRPGIMKTPALDEAKKPLQRLEMDTVEDHKKQKQVHEVKLMVLKAKKEEIQKQIKEAIARGASTEGFEIPEDEELILRRYMVNDSTVEKLGVLLNQNPNGLLLFRDELTGWLRTLDREGHENDRAFYLESWNGNGSYTYDRIGRGTLRVEAACVSILGGIQPGPLSDYLESTLKGGSSADGLLQRFQLLVYPDDPGPWKNIDRWPDTKAKNTAFEIFKKLAGESFVSFVSSPKVVSQDEYGDSGIPFLRFSPQGQEVFDDWRSELENKIRVGDEHPAVEAHLSKYRSLMPSLALIFHVVSTVHEGEASAVSLNAAKMACAWCDYLEAHARRVYHGLIQRNISTAHRLSKKIIGKDLPNPFTPRDVYRKCWTGLSDAEVIESGAAILDELGWIRTKQPRTGANGGRPTLEYEINPIFVGVRKTEPCAF